MKEQIASRRTFTRFGSRLFWVIGHERQNPEACRKPIKRAVAIRPWKSRLGLLYVQKHTFLVDLQVIWLTAIAIVSRQRALNGLQHIREKTEVGSQRSEVRGRKSELRERHWVHAGRVSRRREPLEAYPPPGSNEIVMSR